MGLRLQVPSLRKQPLLLLAKTVVVSLLKANELGIRVMNEEEFVELLRELGEIQ